MSCYGTNVITALTAQNTTGAQGIHPSSPEFVIQQINSVLDDLHLDALKTGMLYDVHCVLAVVGALKSRDSRWPLVCDPVCISTSGHSLLDPSALHVLVEQLFPLTTVITPNTFEAAFILSRGKPGSTAITGILGMLVTSQALLELGAGAVLITGGTLWFSYEEIHAFLATHLEVEAFYYGMIRDDMEILRLPSQSMHEEDTTFIVDLLCEKSLKVSLFVQPPIMMNSTHGTGCTLSAAIACNLAQKMEREIFYTHSRCSSFPCPASS